MCNDRLRLMLEVDVVQQLRFWAKFSFSRVLLVFGFAFGLDLCFALLSIIYPLKYSSTLLAIRLRAHGTEDVFHKVYYVEV